MRYGKRLAAGGGGLVPSSDRGRHCGQRAAGRGSRLSGRHTGELAANPIQAWFLQSQTSAAARNWFNQSTLLRLKRKVTQEQVRTALAVVIARHAALRLRVSEIKTATLEIRPPAPELVLLSHEKIVGNSEAELERIAVREHQGFNLATSPVFRAVLIEDGMTQRLLLAAHHLAVDFVSWRIICEDLSAALSAMFSGQPPVLPTPTSGLRQWVDALRQAAEQHSGEVSFWASQLVAPVPALAAPPQECREGDCVFEYMTIEPELVARLRGEGCAAYRCEWPELLLAVLAGALGNGFGLSHVSIAMESHGRDLQVTGASAERVVGWFTALYPVLIELEDNRPATVAKAVHEAAAATSQGARFGLLRYLTVKGGEELGRLPAPTVLFHYAGDAAAAEEKRLVCHGAGSSGTRHQPDRLRTSPVEVTAEGGPDGSLRFQVSGPASLGGQLKLLAAELARSAALSPLKPAAGSRWQTWTMTALPMMGSWIVF